MPVEASKNCKNISFFRYQAEFDLFKSIKCGKYCEFFKRLHFFLRALENNNQEIFICHYDCILLVVFLLQNSYQSYIVVNEFYKFFHMTEIREEEDHIKIG